MSEKDSDWIVDRFRTFLENSILISDVRPFENQQQFLDIPRSNSVNFPPIRIS